MLPLENFKLDVGFVEQAGCLFHGYSDRANTNLTNYYTPYMEASPSNSFQKLVKLSQTYTDKGF